MAQPNRASTTPPSPSVPPDARRGFMTKFAAVMAGTIAALVPIGSGLAVLLDPLRRGRPAGSAVAPVPVATLDAVPEDGTPRQFPVIADRIDAWNRFPDEPVGAVYLRRVEGPEQVMALSAICPHLGCFVGYDADRKQYQCPCHTSAFSLDGERGEPCVALRAMDKLDVEIVDDDGRQQVLVKYQEFYTGIREKKPKL